LRVRTDNEAITAVMTIRLLNGSHELDIKGRSYRRRALEQAIGARV
jgi:hypothetical protein